MGEKRVEKGEDREEEERRGEGRGNNKQRRGDVEAGGRGGLMDISAW